jgi:hypothetical protein
MAECVSGVASKIVFTQSSTNIRRDCESWYHGRVRIRGSVKDRLQRSVRKSFRKMDSDMSVEVSMRINEILAV